MYEKISSIFYSTLTLRWQPFAVKLVTKEEDYPKLPLPRYNLRYCQALSVARRGKSFLMTAEKFACPDGANILGLAELPEKLKSGDIYLKFRKLPSLEVAKKLVEERPQFPLNYYKGIAFAPLGKNDFTPDLLIMSVVPEQAMWLCCASAFHTGERFNFSTNGFNAACVDTTVIPIKNNNINMSFACYGCRSSTDISDNEMYFTLPSDRLEKTAEALELLSEKSIPESRMKIYMPPLI